MNLYPTSEASPYIPKILLALLNLKFFLDVSIIIMWSSSNGSKLDSEILLTEIDVLASNIYMYLLAFWEGFYSNILI